jgi:phosphoribosylformylglycinamidine synthase
MSRTRARVTVRLKPAILDPQGRAVQATLHRLGHHDVEELRVGKIVEFTVDGDPATAEAKVRALAQDVLANPVMEDVEIALEPAAADDG